VVFAVLFSFVEVFDTFVGPWAPRLGQPTAVTLRVPYSPRITRSASGEGSFSYEHVRVIVPRGTVLRETNDDHRAAFAYESLRRPSRPAKIISYMVIHFTLGLMLTAYLRRFGHNRMKLLRTQIGIFVVILLAQVVSKVVLLGTALPEFWVPVAVAPLWIALSFDRRTAFLVNVVLSVVVASLLRFDVLFFFVLLTRGMAATVLFFSAKQPRQMLTAGALAGASVAVLYIAIAVVFEGTFPVLRDLASGLDSQLLACLGGGVVAGVLAHWLREPIERLLGHVSRDHLFSLADLEQPLLQKMAREAPGSWEHARAMANLAEAAASAIGADALLTRVGAYYHDLGKTTQAKYFVENLSAGEKSPHLDLEPDVSADAIMTHVVLGTKILRDGGIPEPVVEFAYTHHGTQIVEYFWAKCQEQGNPHNLTEEHFRYPGMKPQTKETAILMLVDSIEAASRTVEAPDRAKFETMIQRILFTKLKSGQLDDSGLSMEDCRILVNRMADALVNMFHSRVKYPWQQKAAQEAAQEAALKAAQAIGAAATVAPGLPALAPPPGPAALLPPASPDPAVAVAPPAPVTELPARAAASPTTEPPAKA
jgi:hypothetical protein